MKNILTSINWKVRFSNKQNVARLVVGIATPILTYYGLTPGSFTNWGIVGETLVKAISNPYVIGSALVVAYNWLVDPTTAGASDSQEALTYTEPKKEETK